MADSIDAVREVAAGDEGNRRGDILRAAGRLFREKGYNGTTIRDIAAAVGMRSGSPFYHFKTKHDMLRAVVLDGMAAIHDTVTRAAAGVTDPRARFRAMVHAHLHALLAPGGRDFAAAVLHECGALEPEAAAEMRARKDDYERVWDDMLAELQAAGVVRGDVHLTRLMILGAMNWTTQWYSPGGQNSPDEIAAQMCRLVLGE